MAPKGRELQTRAATPLGRSKASNTPLVRLCATSGSSGAQLALERGADGASLTKVAPPLRLLLQLLRLRLRLRLRVLLPLARLKAKETCKANAPNWSSRGSSFSAFAFGRISRCPKAGLSWAGELRSAFRHLANTRNALANQQLAARLLCVCLAHSKPLEATRAA